MRQLISFIGSLAVVITFLAILNIYNYEKGKNNKILYYDKRNIHKISNYGKRKITLSPYTAKALRISHPVYIAKYVMENKQFCSSVKHLNVLVMVYSAATNFQMRTSIRKTWANNTIYANIGTVKVLFLLGMVKDTGIQRKIIHEFRENGDMLQGDFIDSYYNLTLKGVMGFKWVTAMCRNADVIAKTDDDIVVNVIDILMNIELYRKQRHIACKRTYNATIFRNQTSKWFVNDSLFPGLSNYPDYCAGVINIISNDLIPDLYQSILLTPFYFVEDVYLFGLVPGNLNGIRYTDLKYDEKICYSSQTCINDGACRYTAVLLDCMNPLLLERIWDLMLMAYRSDKHISNDGIVKKIYCKFYNEFHGRQTL